MADNSEILRALSKEAAAVRGKAGAKKPLAAARTSYEVTLFDYPDIIITRKTARTTRQLILMVSTGTAFIKAVTGKGDPESYLLTEKSYAEFTADLPDDFILPKGFWMPCLEKGTRAGRSIISVFKSKTVLEMIRRKAVPGLTKGKYNIEDLCACNSSWRKAYESYPQLVLEYKDNQKIMGLLLNRRTFMEDFIRRFGLENTRDFLDSYKESLVILYENGFNIFQDLTRNLSQAHRWEKEVSSMAGTNISVIPGCSLKYESFKNYLLYDSFRMGYGKSIHNFFTEWIDTLNMEYKLYGKFRRKYPEDLPLYHNQLSYKMTMLKEKINEELFMEQVKEACRYEGTYKDFAFIAPRSRQDFLDEAVMQGNCLAGYIGRFTEGNCLILFMRRKKTPELSYITVEIVNGEAVQAKLAGNREVSEEEQHIITEWVKKCSSMKGRKGEKAEAS